MKWLLRLLWFFAGQQVKGGIARRMKRWGVVSYLRTLEGARRIVMVSLLIFFALQMMVLAGAGAVVTGVYLLDLDVQNKLLILFITCCVLFFVPLVILAFALSSRVWYHFSGAEHMVENLRGSKRGMEARDFSARASK